MQMPTNNSDAFDLDDETDLEGDPFASGSSAAIDDADFEEYDAPRTPIGVLPGFVKSAKHWTSGKGVVNLVLEIECTDPTFAGAERVSLFLPKEGRSLARISQIAAALGIAIPQIDGKVRLPKPEAFVNRPGLFTYSTFASDDGTHKPTIAWGYPDKKNKSEQFDKWAAEAKLTDEQKKKIKQSPGVMPLGSF
jgi:hypothetical protein